MGSVYNWWPMGGLASARLSRGAWVSGTRILLHINQPIRMNRMIINMNPLDSRGGEFMGVHVPGGVSL